MRYLYFLLLLFLGSCAPFNHAPGHSELNSLTEENLSSLNGEYSIFSTDTTYRTLEYSLMMTSNFNMLKHPEEGDYIGIKYLGDNTIEANLFVGDSLAQTEKLKGRIKNGYFYLKPMRSVSPFYLLLNGYTSQRTRIGLLENNNLILDNYSGGCAFLVIFPIMCADGGAYNAEYAKR